jgi:hypothetical protein
MYQYQSMCTVCTLTLLGRVVPFPSSSALHCHWLVYYLLTHPHLWINVTPHAQVMSTIMPRGWPANEVKSPVIMS